MSVDTQTDPICWQERRLLVRSLAFAEAAERSSETRLRKAAQQLSTLLVNDKGKRPPTDVASTEAAVEAPLSRQQVQGLFGVNLQVHPNARSIRGYGAIPSERP